MEIIKRNSTQEDIDNAPDDVRAELIDGDLYFQAAPSMKHQAAVDSLKYLLPNKFNSTKHQWLIRTGVAVRYINEEEKITSLIPDISGWRMERIASHEDENPITVCPDWVCEILSPATQKLDRTAKRDAYLKNGVNTLWLLDPLDEMVEVFVASDRVWILAMTCTDEDSVCVPPFEGCQFDFKKIWESDVG